MCNVKVSKKNSSGNLEARQNFFQKTLILALSFYHADYNNPTCVWKIALCPLATKINVLGKKFIRSI